MRIAGIELKDKKLLIAGIAAGGASIIIIYALLYAPLLARLAPKYTECCATETQVMEARSMIEEAGKIYSKRVLPTEKDASYAIEEITKKGQIAGINFVSIKPREAVTDKNPQYKIMPIEINIEASVSQFISFISFLDDMERGLVKVKSFEITPNKDKEGQKMLMADMVLDMYISTRESEGECE